jgi:hypothetical protein
MATLDATVGGPAANSYLTVAEATALLTPRLTALLDMAATWYGYPTTMTQALAWPQTGQVDQLHRAILATTVPVVLQRATALYALLLLEDAAAASAGGGGETGAIKSRKIGDLTITYQDTAPASAAAARPAHQSLPSEVRLLLAPYGQFAGGNTVRLVRT